MTKPRAQRARGIRSIGALCAALVIASAGRGCQRSGDWNEVFHRSEGWVFSDGGISAALPSGRTLWLFGDTRLDRADSVSNSMAVQESEPGRAPLRDELRFFVRDGSGSLLDVSTTAQRAGRPWVEPRANQDALLHTWLWPTAAIVSGGRLIATYEEVGCPVSELPACRGYLGSMKLTGHTVLEVENPADAPDRWRTRETPLLDRNGRPPSTNRMHWGNALFEESGWLYIFGTTFGPNDEVKVARAVPSDVSQYARWQFLTPQGWQMVPTGPAPIELQTLARSTGTDLSIHGVIRRGQAWLLMVHADFLAQELVVRSAPACEIESVRWDGPEAGERVRRFSLAALDPETAGGLSWATRTHLGHSSSGEALLLSLYSGKLSTLRFVELPISALLD